MSKNVAIIGGGVVGLCSAYFLIKDGHNVTIIDKSSLDSGTSYINAGYLCPGHVVPLAAPGVIKQGIKWMFNSASPLYIEPRIDLDFFKWVYAFNKSCSNRNVKKSIPGIINLSILSQDLFQQIKDNNNFKFHYEKKGLLTLCKSEKSMIHEEHTVKLARENGLEAKMINNADIKRFEPNVEIDSIGGAYFKCDQHTTPSEFMSEMKEFLLTKGVRIIKNTSIQDFTLEGDKIKNLFIKDIPMKFDEYVFATGAWTNYLCKKIGIKLLLQAGKGYSMNVQEETNISIPAILVESKCAITPMNGFTRFSGTMEIASINNNIRRNRVDAIANSVSSYYPNLKINEDVRSKATFGLRSISADGLPYIGRSNKIKNIVIATGHNMTGWSMSTGTGKLVSDLISEKKTSIDISVYHPERKF